MVDPGSRRSRMHAWGRLPGRRQTCGKGSHPDRTVCRPRAQHCRYYGRDPGTGEEEKIVLIDESGQSNGFARAGTGPFQFPGRSGQCWGCNGPVPDSIWPITTRGTPGPRLSPLCFLAVMGFSSKSRSRGKAMNFNLTEEHQLIRSGVREFCQKYVEPVAEMTDSEAKFPADTVKKLAEQDWLGIPYPQEYGGAGSDYLSYIIVVEELSRACATTGFTLECHTSLACYPLFKFGTEEQKQKYLAPLCKGEMLGSFALTEPGAGTDAGAASTTAVLQGDQWVINGSKIFISNAPVAGVIIVFAMTDKSKGTK